MKKAGWLLCRSGVLLVLSALAACVSRQRPIDAPTVTASATPTGTDSASFAKLQVTVKDSVTGGSIEGAQVGFYRDSLASAGSWLGIGGITDSGGRALLQRIPPGEYNLVIRRIGYLIVARRIVVGTDGPGQLDVTLTPDPRGPLREVRTIEP